VTPVRPILGKLRSGLSLRQRVGFLVTLSLTAVAASFLYVSVSSRAADMRQELVENGRANLDVIARPVAEQALVGDYASIQQALTACAAQPMVATVTFRDIRGHALSASQSTERSIVPSLVRRLGSPLGTEPVSREVRLGGVRYGLLTLEVDPIPAENRLYRAAIVQVSASLLFVLLIVGLTWRPLRVNLLVMRRLQEAARRFESGEYDARVDFSPGNPPELRQTAKAFNAMGEKIGGLLTALSEQTRAIDNAAVLIEMDVEGRAASVNGRFLEATGLFAETAVGRLLPEMLADGPAAALPDGWTAAVLAGSWRGELPVRGAVGRTVWMDLTITPISDRGGRPEKLLAVGFDVTDRHLAGAALLESRETLRAVLDTIPQHVFWKDRDSVYLGCNRNFALAVGLSSPTEVVGKTDYELPGSAADVEKFRGVDREVIESGEPRLRFVESQLMADGERIWTETSKVPLYDSGGSVVGVLGSYEDVTVRRAAERRIEYLAFHDGLTGLPNRSLLEDRLAQAIASAGRHGHSFAVLFVDLDGFKEVNDRFGHDHGDEFLQQMAGRLQGAVRSGDTVARLGGDEFVLLLAQVSGRPEVAMAAERLLGVIQRPVPVGETTASVTASIGAALYPADDVNGEALLRHADVAMYHAKEHGRNGFRFFDRNMARSLRPDDGAVERVVSAFRDDRLRLLYQPTVQMRSGRVVGVEALLRLMTADGEMKPPGDFLPAIEGSDVIVEVGEWALDEALSAAERWRGEGLDLRISVNVAARQIQHPGFLRTARGALARHPGVPPDRLELEILETTALEDLGVVQGVMARCREMGIRFCLDDFGTGYSSLSYLKRLPVDVVKIDQGFVRDMLEDHEDLAIVQGIVSMATIFRKEVVAEGVATPEHGKALLRLGCELGQGFGIARPMPPEAVPGWATSWKPDAAWRPSGTSPVVG
jgi:diguanylate cyclase (GGDEF)-like protein/PAS domain S-box-containing protein